MKRLRVLIVDDSLTMRHRLAQLFTAEGTFEVVGEATDGQQAFEHCHRLRPDVVTMDLMMPKLDGLRSTELIMAHCPTPIVVLSAAESRTEGQRTMDALAAGAVDAVDKPSGPPDAKWTRTFLERVRMAARVRVITHVRARFHREPVRPPPVVPAVPTLAQAPRLLVVGPPPGARRRELPARRATAGLPPAHAAGASHHRAVRHRHGGVAGGSQRPPGPQGRGRRGPAAAGPAVRAHGTGKSAHGGPEWAVVARRRTRAPLLPALGGHVIRVRGAGTGRVGHRMFTDGHGTRRSGRVGGDAARGATTVVEDESTCVVFGMPREAIRLGAAQHVVGLTALPLLLTALARADAREGTA